MMGSLREMGKGGGNRAGSEGPYEGQGIEKPRAKSAAVGKTLQETFFFLRQEPKNKERKPTHCREEEIQGLDPQEKRTQAQKRCYRDPIDSHRQEYGINFQNKSCCDSRH